MKIAITGVTGLLGKPLKLKLLGAGHQVITICRKIGDSSAQPVKDTFEWDVLTEDFPSAALEGVDTVIHLAGEPVAGGRWTSDRKKKIFDSRVGGARKLVNTLAAIEIGRRPKTLISGSAIGIYGDRSDQVLNEYSAVGTGFLAEGTAAWEKESDRAVGLGLRVVQLRTGIVLSRKGGALSKMVPLTLGSGRQWMSWIHHQDWENIVLKIVADLSMVGTYNLTAPKPVTNAEFSATLGKIRHFPLRARVPAFLLKAAMGEMSEMVLASERIVPTRVLESGYTFSFDTLGAALEELFPR